MDITFNNISYSILDGENKRMILNQITYCFKSPGLFIIVGASGSGKTTILHLLCRMLKPEKGVVELTQQNQVLNLDKFFNFGKSFAFVYQKKLLLGFLNVRDNLSLAYELAGYSPFLALKKSREVLKKNNLFHLFSRKITTLSGGEKARISLLRSIALERPVLLADEPTGELDLVNAQLICHQLYSLAKEKLVIVVTHNQDLFSIYDNATFLLLDEQKLWPINRYGVKS
ncbi:MAG: ATP-binding cassette domain-containing protein [Bacilli bacterium]|jgi:ABC-type lipoprotein export system ATPase subunit